MYKYLIMTTFACLIGVLCCSISYANEAPVVSNVTASQRTDDSKLVDIHYTLADANGDACTVWIVVSDDGGQSWHVPARTFTGDVGMNITPGNKSAVWDAGGDMPGTTGSFKVRIYADDGNGPASMVLVPEGEFPYDNTAIPDNWVFVDAFLIDKYEVSNQFYCQFLNTADPSSSHWNSSMEIDRWGDAENYYYSVKSGRDNYPIRNTSYYNATAFCSWRSSLDGAIYRLPSRIEWQKAAAWDPAEQHFYLYGFHSDTIVYNQANYDNWFSGVTEIGSFNGTGETYDSKSFYLCYDMSGNVAELTGDMTGDLLGGSSYNQYGYYYLGGSFQESSIYQQATYHRYIYGSAYTSDSTAIDSAKNAKSVNIGFRCIREIQ